MKFESCTKLIFFYYHVGCKNYLDCIALPFNSASFTLDAFGNPIKRSQILNNKFKLRN